MTWTYQATSKIVQCNARGTSLILGRLRDISFLDEVTRGSKRPRNLAGLQWLRDLNLITPVREHGKRFVNSILSLLHSKVSLQGVRVSMQWRG